MAKRFRVGDGKAAIWDDETDTAPFDDPVANISRVKFHTDLDYDAALVAWTGTLSLPSRTVLSAVNNITLFAHGQAGTPYVRGAVLIGGQWTDVVGSLPVSVTDKGFIRCISLGSDGTNVLVTDYASGSNAYVAAGPTVILTGTETHSSQSLSMKVWVFDTLL